jgi:hypothetical protein
MSAVVLLVDDHPVVPLALRGLIEDRFDGVRALQASNLRQARVIYGVSYYCHRNVQVAAYVLGTPGCHAHIVSLLIVERKDQGTSGHRC